MGNRLSDFFSLRVNKTAPDNDNLTLPNYISSYAFENFTGCPYVFPSFYDYFVWKSSRVHCVIDNDPKLTLSSDVQIGKINTSLVNLYHNINNLSTTTESVFKKKKKGA